MKKIYILLCVCFFFGITFDKIEESRKYFFPENLISNNYYDDGILDARNPNIIQKKTSLPLVKNIVYLKSSEYINKGQTKRFVLSARQMKSLMYQNDQFDYLDIDVTTTKMSTLTIYINSVVVTSQQNIGEFFTSTVRIFKGDILNIEIYAFNSSDTVTVSLNEGCKLDSGTISHYIRPGALVEKIFKRSSGQTHMAYSKRKPDKLWNISDIKFDYGSAIESSFSLWELQSGFSVLIDTIAIVSFKITDITDVEGGNMPIGSSAMYHDITGDIYVNVDNILSKHAGLSSVEFDKFKLRVISHELGHLIGLKDMGTSQGYSIMSSYENVLYPSKADLAVFRYIIKNLPIQRAYEFY